MEGGEGLAIQVEPGDYFASVLPGDPQGTFTINLGGASGTVSATKSARQRRREA